MPEPTTTAFDAAQRVLTAVNTLENCPAWAGWYLPKLEELAKGFADQCVTGESAERRADARIRCLQVREIIKLTRVQLTTAEDVVAKAHEQRAQDERKAKYAAGGNPGSPGST
jgi:hypothetical protein